jgi:hypothetical protein
MAVIMPGLHNQSLVDPACATSEQCPDGGLLAGFHQHLAGCAGTALDMPLSQVTLEGIGLSGANAMKRDGKLIGLKPGRFFNVQHRSDTIALVDWTPLPHLAQKIFLLEKILGPFYPYRAGGLCRITQVKVRSFQLTA